MQMIPKLVVALLASVSLAAPAQAQVAPEAKRAIRAALSTCIDWVRGKADWRNTPPPGFEKPLAIENLSFSLAAGAGGEKPEAYWAEAHARFSSHALRLAYMDDSCVVVAPAAIRSPTLKELVDDVDAAAISHAKGKILLGYYESVAEDGHMMRFFESDDERQSVLVFVMHGWKDGKPAPGQFAVGVRLQ